MKEELKYYGLSEKEIEIYLAALKTGESTANKLSEVSNIRRTTTYEIIENLKQKGLISSITKNKKYYFIAANPDTLIDKLEDKKRTIKNIIPKLNELQNINQVKTNTEIFEGKIGIKNAVNQLLDSKKILCYGGSIQAEDIFDGYTSNFAQRRIKKKIILKAIIEEDIPKHMLTSEIKKLTKIKTLKKFQNHKTTYFIGEDIMIIVTFELGEFTAIKIKSPTLIESQKIIFETLWKIAN